MLKKVRIESERGFTLLEVLIGLVLLSIMMTLLFGAIRMGARIWDAGEEKAAQLDRMLIVQNLLRQRLTTARAVFDDFSGDEPEFSFSGTEDSIQFVSNLPSSARRGGLHLFKLELVDEGDIGVLYVKLKPFYPPLDGVDTEIEDVRLISGVDELLFSYYGSDEFDRDDVSSATWMEQWTEKDFMPILIKMEVRMQDGNEWPPMIVNPKLISSNQGQVSIPIPTPTRIPKPVPVR